jgi:hypothetical protein
MPTLGLSEVNIVITILGITSPALVQLTNTHSTMQALSSSSMAFSQSRSSKYGTWVKHVRLHIFPTTLWRLWRIQLIRSSTRSYFRYHVGSDSCQVPEC